MRIKRKMLGKTGQRSQVKPARAGATDDDVVVRVGLPVQVKIHRLDTYCLAGLAIQYRRLPCRQTDLSPGDLKAGLWNFGAEMPGHMIERQDRKILGQTHAYVLQRNICHNLAQAAFGEAQPRTNAPLPMR